MIPQTLRVRGHVYEIQQVDPEELSGVCSGCSAFVDNNYNIIRISRRTSPSRKVELVFHEVLHAMISGYDIDDAVEEIIVMTLGEALTEFIKANPSFIRHALKTLTDKQS